MNNDLIQLVVSASLRVCIFKLFITKTSYCNNISITVDLDHYFSLYLHIYRK